MGGHLHRRVRGEEGGRARGVQTAPTSEVEVVVVEPGVGYGGARRLVTGVRCSRWEEVLVNLKKRRAEMKLLQRRLFHPRFIPIPLPRLLLAPQSLTGGGAGVVTVAMETSPMIFNASLHA